MRASEMVIGLAAVMLAGLPSVGFAQQVILSTDRPSYLLHEPVELRIDYVNRADKPWALELESVWLSASEPGGPQRSVGLWQNRRDDVIDKPPLHKLVGPGQTYRRVVWVALDKNGDWIFPGAGRWQLGVQGLPAAQIEIEIVEPAVGDSKDAAALFDTGACRTFLSDGNDVGDAVPVLQEIVEKYPRTTFAFFAAWTLVQDRWVHRYEKGMDWEKERAWLSLILQVPQDHPLRPAAMYAMIRHHNFQHGHKDQAEKSAEDLAEAYPWSTWAHDVKSQFGHDVSAKLAPFSDDPALKSRHEVTEPAPAAQPGDKPAAVPPDGGRASSVSASPSAPAEARGRRGRSDPTAFFFHPPRPGRPEYGCTVRAGGGSMSARLFHVHPDG
jgi:hypothetical protein